MRTLLACSILSLASVAVAQTPPATPPATQPGRDWFGALPADEKQPGTFAALYPALASADPAIRAATPRIVYGGIQWEGQPASVSFANIRMVYDWSTNLSRAQYDQTTPKNPWLLVPDERKIRINAVDAKQRGGMPVCLDIEEFPLDASLASEADVSRGIREVAKAIQWVRAQDPSARVFLYSFLPLSRDQLGFDEYLLRTERPGDRWFDDVGRRRSEIEKKGDAWRRANARLRSSPEHGLALGDLVDAVCPSLYIARSSFIPETAIRGVRADVWAHVEEARKYGKPVYPFVWPLYFPDGPEIDLLVWATQIREVMLHADGVVLWDGYKARWRPRIAVRVEIVRLLAESKGQLTNAQLHENLKAKFPQSDELERLLADQ